MELFPPQQEKIVSIEAINSLYIRLHGEFNMTGEVEVGTVTGTGFLSFGILF